MYVVPWSERKQKREAYPWQKGYVCAIVVEETKTWRKILLAIHMKDRTVQIASPNVYQNAFSQARQSV